MTRITRADAELDAKLEREERLRKEAELRAQGITPPQPSEPPKTVLGWVGVIVGLICLVGFFLGFYFLAMSILR